LTSSEFAEHYIIFDAAALIPFHLFAEIHLTILARANDSWSLDICEWEC